MDVPPPARPAVGPRCEAHSRRRKPPDGIHRLPLPPHAAIPLRAHTWYGTVAVDWAASCRRATATSGSRAGPPGAGTRRVDWNCATLRPERPSCAPVPYRRDWGTARCIHGTCRYPRPRGWSDGPWCHRWPRHETHAKSALVGERVRLIGPKVCKSQFLNGLRPFMQFFWDTTQNRPTSKSLNSHIPLYPNYNWPGKRGKEKV